MRIAYYPGCSLHSTAIEYDMSAKAVCEALGIELVELEDWNCCGATAVHAVDHLLSIALSARNLAIAEKAGLDLYAPCSACFHNLANTNKLLKEDAEIRDTMEKVMEDTGLNYGGGIEVKHLLDVMVNGVGYEKIAESVVKPLKGLKVAPYYGCLIVKPSTVANFDSQERPQTLDHLIETLGAECVPYHHKTECCGGSLTLIKEEVASKMTMDILLGAKEAGADCVITTCPACLMNLDVKQSNIELNFDVEIGMPVLYFTQLMGLAFGIDSDTLGFDKNFVDTSKVLEALSTTVELVGGK